MQKILILEDEPEIAKLLTQFLETEKFETAWANSIESANQLLSRENFDLALLDINLPDGSGLELCFQLRRDGYSEPILFLTAQLNESFVLKAFEIGANDYIKKPFSLHEVVARIRAHLNPPHRFPADPPQVTDYKGLSIDPHFRSCEYRGKSINLNKRQIEILLYMIQRQSKVVTRKELAEFLNLEPETSDRTIDAHLSQLRKKLKDQKVSRIAIQSVYGVGYRLQ